MVALGRGNHFDVDIYARAILDQEGCCVYGWKRKGTDLLHLASHHAIGEDVMRSVKNRIEEYADIKYAALGPSDRKIYDKLQFLGCTGAVELVMFLWEHGADESKWPAGLNATLLTEYVEILSSFPSTTRDEYIAFINAFDRDRDGLHRELLTRWMIEANDKEHD
jgi:hypothetical protein